MPSPYLTLEVINALQQIPASKTLSHTKKMYMIENWKMFRELMGEEIFLLVYNTHTKEFITSNPVKALLLSIYFKLDLPSGYQSSSKLLVNCETRDVQNVNVELLKEVYRIFIELDKSFKLIEFMLDNHAIMWIDCFNSWADPYLSVRETQENIGYYYGHLSELRNRINK